MSVSARAVLASLREAAADTAWLPIGDGDLVAVDMSVADRHVVTVAFDYDDRHGSIGTREADQLVRLLRHARAGGTPVVLLLETSGIRVTDGTAGIASLRRLLREAEDARLDGVPMLAVVLRCAFGGASILASLCDHRLLHAASLYGMSGPRLIAASSDGFDAADRHAVAALLGGAARARFSGFELVEPAPAAFAHAVARWLAALPARPIELDLARRGDELEQRLSDLTPPPTAANTTAPAAGGVRTLTLHAHDGTGARHALALAAALLVPADGAPPPGRTAILVDTPGHLATPDEERVVLSDHLAHLALAIRMAHRRGEQIDVIVTGLGGGGIQGALGSGATSVSMAPGARLLVLPPVALRALDKAQGDGEGRLDEALRTGAVDRASAPETVSA